MIRNGKKERMLIVCRELRMLFKVKKTKGDDVK